MQLVVLAVRDRGITTYGAPVFVAHINLAIRAFMDSLTDEKSQFSKHPAEYDLYELGTFDDQTGQFKNLEQPRQVSMGRDLRAE